MTRVRMFGSICFTLASIATLTAFVHSSSAEQSRQLSWCPTRPILIVWTSHSCVPCRAFWNDLECDASFRAALTTRYRLQWIDADVHRDAALRNGIHTLPTFQSPELAITGYQGKQWLWNQLTATTIEEQTDDSSPDSLQSDVDQVQSEPVDEQSSDATAPLPPLMRPPRLLDGTEVDSPEVLSTPSQPASDPPTQSTTILPQSPNVGEPGHTPRSSLWTRLTRVFTRTAPIALTALELAGLISGTAATGGIGTFAITVLWSVFKRRWQRRHAQGTVDVTRSNDPQREEETRSIPSRAPFPRQLDEARELLALRQSEGRVAVLDALRGMFLDDELTKLKTEGSDSEASFAHELRTRIDNRVDEVAPLSTSVDGG